MKIGNTWAILAALLVAASLYAVPLSNPAVDNYNVRLGTETFSGLYKFTTNTLLVETADAIHGLGADVIKFYLGSNTSAQSGVTLTANITNLLTLARDEPSYRRVFDMPFKNFIAWAYPFSNPDAPFKDGYSAIEAANDYREMFQLTQYLLTNYSNSGKSFYLGHWEGDGYFEPWTTNTTATAIQGMIDWDNNRQKAVDDAKHATASSNVMVYYYAECNRVRDAMLNPPNNNKRVINTVIPYVTNLDYVSYSSYDAQNLTAADLTTTLNYIEARIPTNKASQIPGQRLFIGEYGFSNAGNSPAAQEPLTRAYIQRLLNYGSQDLPFILFWEIYNNEPGNSFELIDSNNVPVPSYYLHQRFINQARLPAARFNESNGRLPTDAEFVSLVSPLLDQPLPAPVDLTVSNLTATVWSGNVATISGWLTQGIYASSEAAVVAYWGAANGGNDAASWQNSAVLGLNTNFNPSPWSLLLTNLSAATNYYYAFRASNPSNQVWSAVHQFATAGIDPGAFKHRLRISFAAAADSLLGNFPALVTLSPSLAGFAYSQFASATGADLRFTDSGGLTPLPFEINRWNPNGPSTFWVLLPELAGTNTSIWAYWGNPADTNLPASSTNGAVWRSYNAVWHFEQSGFPYRDSSGNWPISNGSPPASISGWAGQAASFSGNSWLDAGKVSLPPVFTLSAWVNLQSGAANIQTIFANKPGGWNTDGVSLYINTYNTSDRAILLETGDGTTGSTAQTAAGAITEGQWHLISATVDTLNGVAKIYIDGTNKTQTSALTSDFTRTAEFQVGRFVDASFPFHGAIDEARIQNGLASSAWLQACAGLSAAFAPINAQPVLSLAPSPSGASLTWPANAGVFQVFAAANLSPPIAWSLETNPPQLLNGHWALSLRAGDSSRFYRLQW